MADKGSTRQEMPPPGGYRKFNFNRTYPKIVWRRMFLFIFIDI